MQATEGDEIVVRGHHVGEAERRGVIIDVRGDDGGPPFVVRWSDGNEDLFVPSSDALIHSVAPTAAEVPVWHGKRKEKVTASRQAVGRRLVELGTALMEGRPASVEVDGETVQLAVPDELRCKVKVESDEDGSELELELEW